jgi:DASS family divalent anion:Na+ symporter
MAVCAQSNVITSAMFLTSMAANPLAVKFAENAGYRISWMDWAIAAIVPGLVSLILMPLLIYYLYPPSIKHSDTAPLVAKEKLQSMGKVQFNEIIMILVFCLLIFLWIFGHKYNLGTTTVALLGLAILFVTQVVNFEDNLSDKGAWHIFIWFATLVMLSDYLSKFGLASWVGSKMQDIFADASMLTVLIVSSFIYFYIHYFFASATAHIALLFPTFLVIFTNAGVPGILAAFILIFLSILSSGLTHFGLASIPIFFGAGHLKTKAWWYIGFITALLYIAVWTIVGGAWWKLLNLW